MASSMAGIDRLECTLKVRWLINLINCVSTELATSFKDSPSRITLKVLVCCFYLHWNRRMPWSHGTKKNALFVGMFAVTLEEKRRMETANSNIHIQLRTFSGTYVREPSASSRNHLSNLIILIKIHVYPVSVSSSFARPCCFNRVVISSAPHRWW